MSFFLKWEVLSDTFIKEGYSCLPRGRLLLKWRLHGPKRGNLPPREGGLTCMIVFEYEYLYLFAINQNYESM